MPKRGHRSTAAAHYRLVSHMSVSRSSEAESGKKDSKLICSNYAILNLEQHAKNLSVTLVERGSGVWSHLWESISRSTRHNECNVNKKEQYNYKFNDFRIYKGSDSTTVSVDLEMLRIPSSQDLYVGLQMVLPILPILLYRFYLQYNKEHASKMRTMVNYDYIFIQYVTAVPMVATVSKLSDGESSTSAIMDDILINTAVVEKQVKIQSTMNWK